MDTNFHRQFHQLLHYMLRIAGLPGGFGPSASAEKWRKLLENPVTRKTAQGVLVEAAMIFDTACSGTTPPTPKLAPIIRQQIAQGKWNFE